MEDQITDYGLTRECEQLAKEIFDEIVADLAPDETPEDKRDEMSDRAHETADGHQWVIYTQSAMRICAECDISQGEESLEEVGAPDPFTLDAAISIAAYGEMRARIEQALDELLSAWEDDV